MNGWVQGVFWIAVLLVMMASAAGTPERVAMVLGWTVIGAFRWWRAQKNVKR